MEATSEPTSPTLPPGFEVRWDETAEAQYLVNVYTGETVYSWSLAETGHPYWSRLWSLWTYPERDFSEYRSILRQPSSTRPLGLGLEKATEVLQRFGRRVVALQRTGRRVAELFDKYYDEQSGCFFYQHRLTQATQWHKPMGLVPHKDVAMASTEADGSGDNEGGWLPPIAGTQGQESQEASYWGRTPQTRKYREDSYMNGPIFRKTGYFRDVEWCQVNNLKVEKPFADKKIHRTYHDVIVRTTNLGDNIVWETKYERHEVKIDEYQLVRSAAERGSDTVVRVMAAHPTNMAIQIQGWLQLATFDYPGTRDGASSYKCVEVINAALVVLDRPKVHESILLHTLQALVVVSAHYQNRAVLVRKGIIERVINLHKKIKKDKMTMRIGSEDRMVESLAPFRVSLAYHTVKLTGALAYDDANRVTVTTECTLPLLHTLKVCADESHVVYEGLLALYNFVFLNEDTHMFLTEMKVLKNVKRLLEPFSHDKEIMKAGRRCITALSPGGWRALENV